MIISTITLSLMITAGAGYPQQEDMIDISKLNTCGKISNDVRRLACYDSVLKDVQLMDPDTKKNSYGFSAHDMEVRSPKKPTIENPKTGATQADKEPSTTKRILNAILLKNKKTEGMQAEIGSYRKNSYGKYVIKLKDGSVWVQKDSGRRSLRKSHTTVTISEGSMGSYFLSPEGVSWRIRVSRVK